MDCNYRSFVYQQALSLVAGSWAVCIKTIAAPVFITLRWAWWIYLNRPVSYNDVLPPLRIFTYGTDVVKATKATEISGS